MEHCEFTVGTPFTRMTMISSPWLSSLLWLLVLPAETHKNYFGAINKGTFDEQMCMSFVQHNLTADVRKATEI